MTLAFGSVATLKFQAAEAGFNRYNVPLMSGVNNIMFLTEVLSWLGGCTAGKHRVHPNGGLFFLLYCIAHVGR